MVASAARTIVLVVAVVVAAVVAVVVAVAAVVAAVAEASVVPVANHVHFPSVMVPLQL